jgi:hypothetical protein
LVCLSDDASLLLSWPDPTPPKYPVTVPQLYSLQWFCADPSAGDCKLWGLQSDQTANPKGKKNQNLLSVFATARQAVDGQSGGKSGPPEGNGIFKLLPTVSPRRTGFLLISDSEKDVLDTSRGFATPRMTKAPDPPPAQQGICDAKAAPCEVYLEGDVVWHIKLEFQPARRPGVDSVLVEVTIQDRYEKPLSRPHYLEFFEQCASIPACITKVARRKDKLGRDELLIVDRHKVWRVVAIVDSDVREQLQALGPKLGAARDDPGKPDEEKVTKDCDSFECWTWVNVAPPLGDTGRSP